LKDIHPPYTAAEQAQKKEQEKIREQKQQEKAQEIRKKHKQAIERKRTSVKAE